ncbi:hypothetical protein H6F79_24410 [Trichocoleus sp. FACHB-69]|uniref:hypothetical protein n=1 Tax=Trichocoleus sp. FACHB-69 TaxID=2692874 RepID=UPI001681E81F|nr:hypothetical protein [Trichocoleus sp. FACHB-69]MBD1934932.1 hypothetical protein [Trichocoleus sp. FACHB-69]
MRVACALAPEVSKGNILPQAEAIALEDQEKVKSALLRRPYQMLAAKTSKQKSLSIGLAFYATIPSLKFWQNWLRTVMGWTPATKLG